jgi:hypothetical protein
MVQGEQDKKHQTVRDGPLSMSVSVYMPKFIGIIYLSAKGCGDLSASLKVRI